MVVFFIIYLLIFLFKGGELGQTLWLLDTLKLLVV